MDFKEEKKRSEEEKSGLSLSLSFSLGLCIHLQESVSHELARVRMGPSPFFFPCYDDYEERERERERERASSCNDCIRFCTWLHLRLTSSGVCVCVLFYWARLAFGGREKSKRPVLALTPAARNRMSVSQKVRQSLQCVSFFTGWADLTLVVRCVLFFFHSLSLSLSLSLSFTLTQNTRPK